jgi:hypothetical protein
MTPHSVCLASKLMQGNTNQSVGEKRGKTPCALQTLTGQGLVAEWTGLEPATPGVTGRYSNQLNYHSW